MSEKFIVVTGAAGGIGLKTCHQLSKNGFQIFALDKILPDANERSKGTFTWIKCDITKRPEVFSAYESIKSYTNELHGLVNIAGIFNQFPLMEADHEHFDQLVNVNFIGHQHLTRTLFPLLFTGKGRVVNLSSETILAPMPLQAYAFSKRLFEVWSDQLSMELRLLGMKVIIIRAGGHNTNFIHRSADVLSNYDDTSKYAGLLEKVKENGNRILKGITNDPEDVAMKVVHSFTVREPSSKYHVNVSWLFRSLSMIPASLRKKIILRKLKSWM
jgi:NAD(P)-dependent dehydrogenase (short-subunit alcohol dehydrogenase family)